MSTESALDKVWWRSLDESMKCAAEEEKRLAISKGSYHNGIPAITVVVDAGWSKRSHKHSYNAKSGVGIVVGMETKKLLHVGVKNKYCSVCAQWERNQQTMNVTRTGIYHHRLGNEHHCSSISRSRFKVWVTGVTRSLDLLRETG